MADDAQERTEDPTEKKKKDSKEKGQVPRSKELATVFVLVGTAVSFIIWGRYLGSALFEVWTDVFTLSREEAFDEAQMIKVWSESVPSIFFPLFALFILTFVGAIIGSIAVGGFNFSWKAAAFKPDKMSPIKGFKRMFGLNGLVELLKSIGKVSMVGVIAYLTFVFYIQDTLDITNVAYPYNIFEAIRVLEWAFLILCLALTPIVIIDIPWQLHQHNEQMKMTKQEVKDEYKNTEGDPLVKSQIRRIQYQMAQARMMQDVPEADVVVTNPTHFSVALKYDSQKFGAPVVVAKGVEEMAFHIRKIAKSHDVPVLEVPPLARAIYYSTRIGQQVPDKLFVAVAQVLAYVYQLKEYNKGKARRPKALDPNPEIPEDMIH